MTISQCDHVEPADLSASADNTLTLRLKRPPFSVGETIDSKSMRCKTNVIVDPTRS